jgi:hypothetical protein
MAVVVLAASFLPGYALLAVAVKRRITALDLSDLLGHVDQPLATLPLRVVRQELRQFTDDSNRLRKTIINTRQALDEELPAGNFGMRSQVDGVVLEAR